MRQGLCLHVFLLVAVASCEQSSREAHLSPLPTIVLSAFEPAVRRQLEEAEVALSASPEDAGLNGRLGMLLEAYNWRDEARVCYERATILAPQDYRWSYYRGRIEAELGKTTDAIRSLGRSAALKKDYVPALLALGDLSSKEGNVGEAERWFGRVLEKSPRSTHALLGSGQVLAQRGDLDGAIARYREALEVEPNFGPAYYQLALAYRLQGKTEEARRELERHTLSRKVFPPKDPLLEEVRSLRLDADSVYRSAAARFKQGQFAEAARLYRRAAELNPSLTMATYNLALTLQNLNRHEEAIPHYEKYLAQHPSNPDAHNNLGLSFYHLGRYDEAIARIRKAVAADPKYLKGLRNLGMVHFETGDLEAAASQYLKVISSRPEDVESHLALGRISLSQGGRDDAVAHFLMALKYNPREVRAHKELLRLVRGSAGVSAAESEESRFRTLANYLKTQGLHQAATFLLEQSSREN